MDTKFHSTALQEEEDSDATEDSSPSGCPIALDTICPPQEREREREKRGGGQGGVGGDREIPVALDAMGYQRKDVE